MESVLSLSDVAPLGPHLNSRLVQTLMEPRTDVGRETESLIQARARDPCSVDAELWINFCVGVVNN